MNLELIKKCAELSKLTYYSIKRESDQIIYDKTIKNIRFIAYSDNEKIIISVRGSDNKSNWFLDFSYLKKFSKSLDVYLHSGFKKGADALYKDIFDFLRKEAHNKKIILTGHSLGGSIASILAFKLSRYFEIDYVITFGQPKFTNKEGAIKLSKSMLIQKNKYIRIINDKDIVNLMPPNTFLARIFGKFQHCGSEIILLDDHKVSINDWNKVLSKNYCLYKNIDSESIKEHKMKEYINKLNELKNIKHIDHKFEV